MSAENVWPANNQAANEGAARLREAVNIAVVVFIMCIWYAHALAELVPSILKVYKRLNSNDKTNNDPIFVKHDLANGGKINSRKWDE